MARVDAECEAAISITASATVPSGSDQKAAEEAAAVLKALADEHTHARSQLYYGYWQEKIGNESEALSYFRLAAAQIGRDELALDTDAREEGKRAAFELMRRVHMREARAGLKANNAVRLQQNTFEAKVVHVEKATSTVNTKGGGQQAERRE